MGVSKGRGFQGVVKRHHFGGFPATHGTHEMRRATGSVGMRTWPAKIIKGKRLPGQMGDERVTVQNLRVVEVNDAENAVLIKGSLPGHRRAMVVIRSAIKKAAPKRDVHVQGGAKAPEAAQPEASA